MGTYNLLSEEKQWSERERSEGVNNDDQRDVANHCDGLPSLDHPWNSSITSKAGTERKYGERDAFVVMASQNHRWATVVLLVLLHISTGFTEKGDCYDEFVLFELEIFNKSCWNIFGHQRKLFSLIRGNSHYSVYYTSSLSLLRVSLSFLIINLGRHYHRATSVLKCFQRLQFLENPLCQKKNQLLFSFPFD